MQCLQRNNLCTEHRSHPNLSKLLDCKPPGEVGTKGPTAGLIQRPLIPFAEPCHGLPALPTHVAGSPQATQHAGQQVCKPARAHRCTRRNQSTYASTGRRTRTETQHRTHTTPAPARLTWTSGCWGCRPSPSASAACRRTWRPAQAPPRPRPAQPLQPPLQPQPPRCPSCCQ